MSKCKHEYVIFVNYMNVPTSKRNGPHSFPMIVSANNCADALLLVVKKIFFPSTPSEYDKFITNFRLCCKELPIDMIKESPRYVLYQRILTSIFEGSLFTIEHIGIARMIGNGVHNIERSKNKGYL